MAGGIVPALMNGLTPALTIGGGILQYQATKDQGRQAQRMGNLEAAIQADQLNTAANEEQAAAGRAAKESRRQGRILQSRAIAAAAAGGGSAATDKNISGIVGDIESEAEYRALTNTYQGDSTATNLRNRAKVGTVMANYQGKSGVKAANTAAYAGLLGTAGSVVKQTFGSKYGGYNGNTKT